VGELLECVFAGECVCVCAVEEFEGGVDDSSRGGRVCVGAGGLCVDAGVCVCV
jgi:hypothetical protein